VCFPFQVTHQNEENQVYLLRYENGALVDVLIRMFRLCCNEIPLYPVLDPAEKESTGVVIREALLANLKVLINLTHDFKGQCKYCWNAALNVVSIGAGYGF